jgi:hypothetical protein
MKHALTGNRLDQFDKVNTIISRGGKRFAGYDFAVISHPSLWPDMLLSGGVNNAQGVCKEFTEV